MDFFSECKDKEEAKKVYRTLAKCFHPDKGGNNELMLQLKQQYEKFEPKYNNFNQKRTSFYEQVFDDAKYQFNRINRNSHIPFDHPIHDIVRGLNSRIEALERQLSIQNITSNDWYHKYLDYLKINAELEKQLKRMENIIDGFKDHDAKKMKLWDFLKFKWNTDEK